MKQDKFNFWVVVALILIAGWFFIWKPAAERRCINAVLVADNNNEQQIVQQATLSDAVWDQSEMVGKIVAGMREIDLSGCPDDFRDAYLRHIDAWAAYQHVAESYGGWTGFIKGFVTAGAAAISASQESSSAQNQIESTYNDVLIIAQEHGVKPPS